MTYDSSELNEAISKYYKAVHDNDENQIKILHLTKSKDHHIDDFMRYSTGMSPRIARDDNVELFQPSLNSDISRTIEGIFYDVYKLGTRDEMTARRNERNLLPKPRKDKCRPIINRIKKTTKLHDYDYEGWMDKFFSVNSTYLERMTLTKDLSDYIRINWQIPTFHPDDNNVDLDSFVLANDIQRPTDKEYYEEFGPFIELGKIGRMAIDFLSIKKADTEELIQLLEDRIAILENQEQRASILHTLFLDLNDRRYSDATPDEERQEYLKLYESYFLREGRWMPRMFVLNSKDATSDLIQEREICSHLIEYLRTPSEDIPTISTVKPDNYIMLTNRITKTDTLECNTKYSLFKDKKEYTDVPLPKLTYQNRLYPSLTIKKENIKDQYAEFVDGPMKDSPRTIDLFDMSILNTCLSLLQEQKDRGLPLGISIHSIYEFMTRTDNWHKGNLYEEIEKSIEKLTTMEMKYTIEIQPDKKGKYNGPIRSDFSISKHLLSLREIVEIDRTGGMEKGDKIYFFTVEDAQDGTFSSYMYFGLLRNQIQTINVDRMLIGINHDKMSIAIRDYILQRLETARYNLKHPDKIRSKDKKAKNGEPTAYNYRITYESLFTKGESLKATTTRNNRYKQHQRIIDIATETLKTQLDENVITEFRIEKNKRTGKPYAFHFTINMDN